MRIVMFMASRYGLECYRAIKDMEDVEIVGILTPPEQFVLKYESVKTKKMDNTIYEEVTAEQEINDVPIYVTDRMNDEISVRIVRNWNPDLIVVSGWYHIIKKEILGIPLKGIIGLHSSLLPRYRGGAPLVWQLINGEEKAGITLFYIEEGTDTGDIIGQKEVQIEDDDDIGTLYKKVGEKGIALLRKYIPQIANNCAPRKKQVEIEKHKVYSQRKKEDGRIDWSNHPVSIYNFVRAQTKPYPGAFSFYRGYQVFIWKCKVVSIEEEQDNIAGKITDIWEQDGKKYPVISSKEQGYGIQIIDYSLEPEYIKVEIKKGERFI